MTYARKEDAASCIDAVDGSQNGERVLRAQFGTTKYCSAYIRGEQCQNRNCMFLHEPGEDRDSFTRQDLSSMNVISTQQPSQGALGHNPPPQTQQPVAAAVPPTTRQDGFNQPSTPSEPQGPALPPSAAWASRPPMSRSASRIMSSTPAEQSPSISTSELVATAPQPAESIAPTPPTARAIPQAVRPPSPSDFVKFFMSFNSEELDFVSSLASLGPDEASILRDYPPLFDIKGGLKRRALKLKDRDEEERRRIDQEERNTLHTMSAVDADEGLERSGSLQLGGEPEDRSDPGQGQRHIIQPPSHQGGLGLDSGLSLDDDMSNLNLASRGLTPQQQQQMLIQHLKLSPTQNSTFPNDLNAQQPGGPFHGNSNQSSNVPGHARNTSRFTFANESSSASAAVKPVANSQLMNQQSAMMPSQASNTFAQQQPFFTSAVSGPPPGLKTSGTPPVSGGGMFGQGHGFATSGVGYGANLTGRSTNDDLMRDLLRRRDMGNQDIGKREYISSPFSHASTNAVSASAPGLLNFPYHSQSNAFQDAGAQKPKKKGKKHRHANTSSSGGGAVDVSDSSILQARIHQSGSSGGQGLYAGQSQGGLQSMMYNGGLGRW